MRAHSSVALMRPPVRRTVSALPAAAIGASALDVPRLDAVHRHGADLREHVALHRADPLLREAAGLPPLREQFGVCSALRLSEARRAPAARVQSVAHHAAVLEGGPARLREAHVVGAVPVGGAQAQVDPLAEQAQALHPRARPGPLDVEHQPVAIGVSARPGGADGGCRELVSDDARHGVSVCACALRRAGCGDAL